MGLKEAKVYNAKTILITGNCKRDFEYTDLHIKFKSKHTPTIQTLTQLLYHAVCGLLDEYEIPSDEEQYPTRGS